MKSINLVLFLILVVSTIQAQVIEDKRLCADPRNIAGDSHANCQSVYAQRFDKGVEERLENAPDLNFPLRIAFVQPEADSLLPVLPLTNTIDILNEAFGSTGLKFQIVVTEVIHSDMIMTDLVQDYYKPYNDFSQRHDLKDTISIYIFNYDPDFCKTNDGILSCGRTGGFSYILSELSNNIVLSKFDLEDHKIIAHEFGHFFGLHHTFEDQAFGKSSATGKDCFSTGDLLCDTPPDPGSLYEVYVNYSKCEMSGNFDLATNIEFKPLIENYMSYYKPCYLKTYSFTNEQTRVLKLAALSPLRKHFSNQQYPKLKEQKN